MMWASRRTALPHCWSAGLAAGALIVTKRGWFFVLGFTMPKIDWSPRPHTCALVMFELETLSKTTSRDTVPYIAAGFKFASQSASPLLLGKEVSRRIKPSPEGAPPGYIPDACMLGSGLNLYQVY